MSRLGDAGEAVRRNVRRVREGQRLTYVEVSNRLATGGRPIPVLGLRRIEQGERRVDVDDLAALATALGVTQADLLRGVRECLNCSGDPPPGFQCMACGAVPEGAGRVR